MDYLARYRNGEHREVTAELTRLTPLRGAALAQARAVAELAMAQVAQNCGLIAARLAAHGYAWSLWCDPNDGGGVSAPLVASGVAARERIRARAGALPLTLDCFWSAVGGVAFTGTHPDFPGLLDPLVVCPAEDVLSQLDDCEPEADGLLHLPLSPDVYHKDNISGGPAYSVAVPQAGFDFVLLDEARGACFLDYLREVILRRGGFAALDPDAPGAVPLAALTAGLRPF
ncbi:hypothetical protein [Lysobacter enzymogenes]|uniref:hypothetical protein n=1 Tax=Lysobacter enzymogenes TaxID=69 RepID=UPI001A976D93|nr:hypothetical protein [Lysobacter enzymogenes]QQP95810.1 hypothetical protein JHW38_21735 [Lysobacter enzymogenes]